MQKFVTLLLVFLMCTAGFAQEQKPQGTPSPASPKIATHKTEADPLKGFGLEDGTPVKLRINRTISSADSKTGDTVDFEVLEEVRIGETLVVPKGGIAWATVTAAQSKRRMGRAGKLDINIDAVRLVTGQKIPLRAVKESTGGSHVGAMTGAMVATGLLLWPAAPFFLFMHGKDITIPKGTEVTAYINGDTPLEQAQFLPKDEPKAIAAAPALTCSLEITSSPAGADIEIDGNFAGNTPTSQSLGVGAHRVKISKKGFAAWERTMNLSAGSVKLSPELTPEVPTDVQPKAN